MHVVRKHREPLLLGLAAGFVSGLFGVGGGVVMVPGLVLLLGLGAHRAHATSVAAIIAAAGAGLIPFAVSGDVDWSKASILLLGGAVGAVAGARLVGRVSAALLTRAFVVLLLVSAAGMAI